MNLFKRIRRNKVVWYIDYKDKSGNRRQKSTGTGKKSEALLELKRLELSLANKSSVILKDFTLGFFDYESSDWIKKQIDKNKWMSPDTALFKKRILENHIWSEFGSRKIGSIKPYEIDKWLLHKKCSNQTKNHILYTFSQIFHEALYQEIIESNPCKMVEKYANNHKSKKPLTNTELEKLFPLEKKEFNKIWADFNWGVMFALIVSSGMRSNEARALKWKHILWEMGAILVIQGLSSLNAITKTKSRYGRGVYIPNSIISLLSDLRQETLYPGDEDFVFCNKGGDFFSRKRLYNQLKRAVEKAGIGRDDISPHSLRHTYNVKMRNLLAQNNLPEDLLRAQIGHKSEKMTELYDNAEVIEKMRRNELVKPVLNDFWG